jgi:calcium/proton exchanger cax
LFASGLLVLGLVIIAGSRASPDGMMRFRRRLPQTRRRCSCSRSEPSSYSASPTSDPAVRALGISKAFTGLVIVAIAGNAVENFVGITLAAKGKSDLAVSVVKNSVAQIAAFLFPALVLLSLAFDPHLTFVLGPVFIGTLVVTALAMWRITGDGEALLFEVQLSSACT